MRAQADAASADTEAQAREAFQRGRVHYDNGEFAQAAEAFQQAYSLSGRDVLLYNLYLAHRDANQTVEAADALRNYLAKVEVIENRPQLEARLKALDAGIAERQAADEQKQQAAASAPTAVATEPAPAAPEANKGWWILPVAVAAGGAVMAVGSIGTGIAASAKARELDDKCMDGVCPASLKSTADQGQLLSITTDVLLIGGLAAIGTGALLFVLRRPGSSAATETAHAALRPDVRCSALGCEGSLALSF